MSNPLVSVIVPTYKRADKIERAILSIVNQGYKNIEIIVVDDNDPFSKERVATQNIVENYSDQVSITMVGTTGSTGGGAARNYAVGQAHGDYLAFLDDDDEFLPDKIETQISFMTEHDLDMSYQDVSWYTESGKLVETRKLDHAKSMSKSDLLRAHLLTPISPTSIYMIRKEAFLKTEGFGEYKTGQDWFLMLRCIESGLSIGYMPGVHVRQYLHDGERLSNGKNKIDGELYRHNVVRGYYDLLSKDDIKYIEFRHNAVLAVSSLRSHSVNNSLRYLCKAFVISPKYSVQELIKFLGDRKK